MDILKKWWQCKVMKFHKWTCNHEKGIPPTDEQLNNGVGGFYDYATMYCDRCGKISEVSIKHKQDAIAKIRN